MANPHPHGYALPAAALHVTTSDDKNVAILFDYDSRPLVLAPVLVYRVEQIVGRDTEQTVVQGQTFTPIEPSDPRLAGDLRMNVTDQCVITLDNSSLEIVWPAPVTICDAANVHAVVFLFEEAPQRYGSSMLSWARN